MDPTTRPYARNILILHLGLLLAVVALVGLASYEVYHRTRDQIVGQAKSRQELLAKQTASAIDSYYSSIAADLSFLRRSEEQPERVLANGPPPPRLLRPLWKQLEGRVSHLLYVHRQTLQILHAYPEETDRETARGALLPFAPFLRDLSTPGVSSYRPTRDGGANVIAVPLSADYVLVAVIPVSNVEEQFFRIVNRDRSSRATLLDETGMVMVTSDVANPAFAPMTLPPADHSSTRPARHVLARMNLSRLKAGTSIDQNHLTTVEPVEVAGRTFHVVVESSLSDITAAVNTMFTRALVGAIFVILSVTAILLSTAVRLIRSRRHLETVRHQMLTRELDQAREIQLRWLPSLERCPPDLRVAAVNQTANHISGDFYDWFKLPDGRSVVTIGDVTGHGMSAAFLMATTQLLVRTTMPRSADPAACLQYVNHELASQAFHGQFVTMLILVLDPAGRTLSIATAGHMPPLIRMAGGFRPVELEPQFPLGIDPEAVYVTERVSLPDDATLLLYTDGTPDAAGEDGSRFGLKRLLETLNAAAADASPQALLSHLTATLTAFRGGNPLSDDLTLVALTFSPRPVQPINSANSSSMEKARSSLKMS